MSTIPDRKQTSDASPAPQGEGTSSSPRPKWIPRFNRGRGVVNTTQKAKVTYPVPQPMKVVRKVIEQGPLSPLQNDTIELEDWGDIGLTPHKVDVKPTFCPDAKPYDDLVDYAYNLVQAKFHNEARHIPKAIFKYYCYNLWWSRVLWIKKRNGIPLTSDQKDFLNMIESETFYVPSHISQYLCSLGNFIQGGETFFMNTLDHTIGESADGGTVRRGYFMDATAPTPTSVTVNNMWMYSQMPSPYMYTQNVLQEVEHVRTGANATININALKPVIDGNTAYPTDNIIGWNNIPSDALHNSWKSTYSQLGWRVNALPPDIRTNYNTSVSTMEWVSSRLFNLKGFKTYSSKQIFTNPMGHSLQCHHLAPDPLAGCHDIRPPAANLAAAGHSTVIATQRYQHSVNSRYQIEPQTLSCSFSFGIRLKRYKITDSVNATQGIVLNSQSAYAPWYFIDRTGAYAAIPPVWNDHMNDTLNYGSGRELATERFCTYTLDRSSGLMAAMILSETR